MRMLDCEISRSASCGYTEVTLCGVRFPSGHKDTWRNISLNRWSVAHLRIFSVRGVPPESESPSHSSKKFTDDGIDCTHACLSPEAPREISERLTAPSPLSGFVKLSLHN